MLTWRRYVSWNEWTKNTKNICIHNMNTYSVSASLALCRLSRWLCTRIISPGISLVFSDDSSATNRIPTQMHAHTHSLVVRKIVFHSFYGCMAVHFLVFHSQFSSVAVRCLRHPYTPTDSCPMLSPHVKRSRKRSCGSGTHTHTARHSPLRWIIYTIKMYDYYHSFHRLQWNRKSIIIE